MARTGFQCKLHHAPNDTSAPTFPSSGSIAPWTQVGGVVTIGLPDEEVGDMDVTELAQLSGADPDSVMRSDPEPFENPGEITFECHLDPAAYLALRGIKGNKRFFRFSMPDPDGASAEVGLVGVGRGYLKKLGGSQIEKTGPVKVKGTVKVAEKWTWS